MKKYSPEIKALAVRRLSAGLSPEEVADQLSLPASAIHRFARELEVAQNKEIETLGRDIRTIEALSSEAQDDYMMQVVRATALKAAVALETLPGPTILANTKQITSLAKWIESVASPKDKADTAKPVVNISALFQKAGAPPVEES